MEDPGSVGNGGIPGFDASVIASWNVVPNQIINEQTDIGVLAFHVNGIDRVEIAVDGGAAVELTTRAFNPRTGVDEFFIRLDPDEFDVASHPAELRATIYPLNAGQVITLDPLPMLINHQKQEVWCAEWGSDTTGDGTPGNPFRQPQEALRRFQSNAGGNAAIGVCDGLLVNLMAGDYAATGGALPYPSTEHSWLTIQGDPSVDASDVRITSGGGIRTKFIRFANLTFQKTMVPSRVLPGGEKQRLWLDETVSIGEGPWEQMDPLAANSFYSSFITNSSFFNLANGPKNVDYIRGSFVENIGQDAYTRCNTIVDCEVSLINPSPGAHADVFQIFCPGNVGLSDPTLIYGLRARDAYAQLIFLADCDELKDLALVNMILVRPCDMIPADPELSQIRSSKITNLIIQNVTLPNQPLLLDCDVAENVAIRSNIFYEVRATDRTPINMIDANQNHFVSTVSHSSIRFGSGSTEGSIELQGGVLPVIGPTMWADGDLELFRPLPGSVVDDRATNGPLLIDATGATRSIPMTLGAMEAGQ